MKDGRARYWLSYGVTDNASDVFQSTDTFRKLCISSSLWSWWSCAYALILCVTDICLMYFNCVFHCNFPRKNCFTIRPITNFFRNASLVDTEAVHCFWLALGCVLHLLKLKVYIFVLRIYRCIVGIRAFKFLVVNDKWWHKILKEYRLIIYLCPVLVAIKVVKEEDFIHFAYSVKKKLQAVNLLCLIYLTVKLRKTVTEYIFQIHHAVR